jgi:hypothetical protein
MAKITQRTIATAVSGDARSQTVHYAETLAITLDRVEHKLRIGIHFDRSYPVQSTCAINRWDGVQWHRVHSIDGRTVPDYVKRNAYGDTPKAVDFVAAREELLRVAVEVLS